MWRNAFSKSVHWCKVCYFGKEELHVFYFGSLGQVYLRVGGSTYIVCHHKCHAQGTTRQALEGKGGVRDLCLSCKGQRCVEATV